MRTFQPATSSKQTEKKVEPKKTEVKKPALKKVKRKPPTVAPIVKMVEPFNVQQFFDQKIDITIGQLCAVWTVRCETIKETG